MKKLRKMMRQRGITQTELAKAAGIGQSSVSAILRGEQIPRWDTVQAIADALGVTTDELRDEQEQEPEQCKKILGQLCLCA